MNGPIVQHAGRGRREFLFLQGLAGPFFSRLGTALAEAGHGVHRVNFHGGDRFYWRRPGAVDYRGDAAGWPAFLEAILFGRGITDVVLFGDCRPLHRAAIAAAGSMHVQVHVFEEGYIRPDWVTLEVGGVNGHSTLPRDPEYYLEAARTLPPLGALPGVPSSFARRAREDLAYNLSALLMAPLYPGYRTHRPLPALVEYAGWAWRLARKPAARRRSETALAQLRQQAEQQRPYFVFPLQLDSDYQIRTHSPFAGMQAAIDQVVGSFARDAPAETLLVVKAHPLDDGLVNWRRRTVALARRLGVQDRVVFLDEADIAPLLEGARGCVTINSTSGTLALAKGVPVITLGQAVYDIPRVTYQDTLEQFWSAPVAPERPVWDAFRRTLVHRCLVRGGYFSEEGLGLLVVSSAARLLAAPAGMRASAAGAAASTADAAAAAMASRADATAPMLAGAAAVRG